MKKISLIFLIAVCLVIIAGCTNAAAVDTTTERFGVSQLYDMSKMVSSDLASSRILTVGILVAIGVFFAFVGARVIIKKPIVPLVGVVFVIIAFVAVTANKSNRAEKIAETQANLGITAGVDQAKNAQATHLQYIHAVVKAYGVDVQPCERTVNRRDFCSANTSYYTHREINVWYETIQHCSTDSDGNQSCWTELKKHWDDEYTPWFYQVVQYWIIPDTATKYLHPGIYNIVSGGPDANPKVILTDWRAPEDQAFYPGEHPDPSRYNAHVPEFWSRVQKAGFEGGTVVVANFVGPYFHWGLASESTQFSTYAGYYDQLKSMAALPTPDGAVFTYKDAYGQDAQAKTLLSSRDGELALDFNPVVNLSNCGLQNEVDKALEFQGQAGPAKQASVRWFRVSSSMVNALGGIENTTIAIKAYLSDSTVWGLFNLPKNSVIIVEQVSDDCSVLIKRNLETGFPTGMGNTLVEQRMRLSIPPEQPVPFDIASFYGDFSGKYAASERGELAYAYTDMKMAGGAIGWLYEETPGWKAPDANDPNCANAPAEHLGFVRYRMCSLQYLKSDIQINRGGALMIIGQVEAGTRAATSQALGWIVLVFGLVIFGVCIFAASQQNSY